MKPSLRAAIAYIAGRIVHGIEARSVLDYTTGEHKRYSGEVSEQRINILDCGRGNYNSGYT